MSDIRRHRSQFSDAKVRDLITRRRLQTAVVQSMQMTERKITGVSKSIGNRRRAEVAHTLAIGVGQPAIGTDSRQFSLAGLRLIWHVYPMKIVYPMIESDRSLSRISDAEFTRDCATLLPKGSD